MELRIILVDVLRKTTNIIIINKKLTLKIAEKIFTVNMIFKIQRSKVVNSAGAGSLLLIYGETLEVVVLEYKNILKIAK